MAMKRAVYKAMAGVMTPKQVVTELGVLAKAGAGDSEWGRGEVQRGKGRCGCELGSIEGSERCGGGGGAERKWGRG